MTVIPTFDVSNEEPSNHNKDECKLTELKCIVRREANQKLELSVDINDSPFDVNKCSFLFAIETQKIIIHSQNQLIADEYVDESIWKKRCKKCKISVHNILK